MFNRLVVRIFSRGQMKEGAAFQMYSFYTTALYVASVWNIRL